MQMVYLEEWAAQAIRTQVRLPRVPDAEHGAAGSAVCFAGFQSCFGLIFAYYAPSLPFVCGHLFCDIVYQKNATFFCLFLEARMELLKKYFILCSHS